MAGNPIFNEKTFNKYAYLTGDTTSRMTIDGTINRGIILSGILLVSAAFAWISGLAPLLLILGVIGSLVFAIATSIKPQWAPITGSLYAVFAGLAMGSISGFVNAKYQNSVVLAVFITMGILFSMLLLYKNRIIRATPAFVKTVIAATGAIFVVYMVSFAASFFGMHDVLMLHSSGPLGIGISLVVIVIASLNLILDFDLIERGANEGAPKFMEWYGAFALLVTLVWIYVRVLELIMKLQRNN